MELNFKINKLENLNYNKIYFYTILLFAFFMPLSRAAISLFTILLPIIWLIEGNFKNKIDYIKSNKVLVSIIFFVGFSTLSILWSENIKFALNIFRLNMYLFTIFVIATSLKKKYINNIITAFLAGMFISEIIAYGVVFELWQFKHATATTPSPFMIHIDYSVYMAFASILLLYRLFSDTYTAKEKLFIGLFFLTVTGNLFLSTGRTGQVAYIFAIFVMFILHYKLTIKSIVLSIITFIVIFVSAYNISNSFNVRVHASIDDVKKIVNMDFTGSFGIRVAYWITTFNIIKENPFGVGLGDYKIAVKNELKQNDYDIFANRVKEFLPKHHPHNQYLLVLLQTGWVGLILFFNLIYQLIKCKNEDKELNDTKLLFTVIFFISCLAEPLLIKQFTIALFVLFIGIFSVKSDLNNLESRENDKK